MASHSRTDGVNLQIVRRFMRMLYVIRNLRENDVLDLTVCALIPLLELGSPLSNVLTTVSALVKHFTQSCSVIITARRVPWRLLRRRIRSSTRFAKAPSTSPTISAIRTQQHLLAGLSSNMT